MSSPATYSRRLAMIWLERNWWMIVLPVAVCLIAGLYDWRWLVVAFALLLIVWPGIMIIVFYDHALRPEARKAIMDKRVTVNPDGSLTVTYLSASTTDTTPPPPPEHIAASDIRQIEHSGKSTVFYLKSSPYDFIEVECDIPDNR